MNAVVDWLRTNAVRPHRSASRTPSPSALINPIQGVLTSAPWWLVVGVDRRRSPLLVSGVRAGRRRGHLPARDRRAPALGAQHGDPDDRSLVATAMTLAVGLVARHRVGAQRAVLGGASGRLLDAAQTMPAFVYLMPAVALFGADPLHGDRGRAHLRGAAGHPPRRGRHPDRPGDGRRGRDGGRLDAAPAALEGPAAGGPAGPAARREPGDRAGPGDGRRRRARRRRRRWATTWSRDSPGATSSARDSRRGSRSSCSGSCSTGSRRAPARDRGRDARTRDRRRGELPAWPDSMDAAWR